MRKLELREVQLMEFEILKEYDRVCRKHQLRYTLGGGTLLGAVRHKGFIPWDNDIDVAMPRADYHKFLKLASMELPKHLKMYTPYNSDSRFSYSKILDLRTIDVEFQHCKEQPLRLYIDIFPLDGMQGTEQERKKRKNKVIRYVKWMHRLKEAKYKKKEAHGLQAVAWYMLSLVNCLVPRHVLIKYIDRYAAKYDFDTSEYVGCVIGGAGGHKELIKREEYAMTGEEEFEGCRFMTLKNTDLYLSNLYGDYMQLPPVEDRVTHSDTFYLLENTKQP